MRKKILQWLVVLVIFLFGIGTNIAQAENRFYVGIGGSYAWSDMNDTIVTEAEIDDIDISLDLGNSFGFNGRFGWRPTDLFALELNFDYLPGFEKTEPYTYLGYSVDLKGEMEIMTLMMDIKLIPLRTGSFELWLLGGAGVMKADLTLDASTNLFNERIQASEDDTLVCGEIGIGMGILLSDTISLNVEGSYVGAYGEFSEYEYGIGYALVTMGLDFYF